MKGVRAATVTMTLSLKRLLALTAVTAAPCKTHRPRIATCSADEV
jgi:hypothetical protein